MKANLKKVVTLVVLVLIAIGVGVGANTYYKKVFAEVRAYKVNKTIQAGFPLTKEDFSEVQIFKSDLYPDSISDITAFVNKSVSVDVAEGSVLREIYFKDSTQFNNLYKVGLEPDHVLISIKTTVEDCVGGIPKPGDRVNLIAIKKAGADILSAETILQNVRVVAKVNSDSVDYEKTSKNGGPVFSTNNTKPDAVVLEVRKEDEALVAAHSFYKLSLVGDNYKPYQPGSAAGFTPAAEQQSGIASQQTGQQEGVIQ